MNETPLHRNAGPIALVAGSTFAVVHLVMFVLFRPDDRIGMLTDPVFRVFNAAYFFAFCLLMIGLVAVYSRIARAAGTLGLIGFLAALVGTMTMAGDMWFDGFASPWLAEVLPQVYSVEKTPILLTGALLSYATFAIGWLLFGLAVLRTRAFPLVISIAIILSGIVGFRASFPPYGVPIGLAFAALGGWMMRKPALVEQRR